LKLALFYFNGVEIIDQASDSLKLAISGNQKAIIGEKSYNMDILKDVKAALEATQNPVYKLVQLSNESVYVVKAPDSVVPQGAIHLKDTKTVDLKLMLVDKIRSARKQVEPNLRWFAGMDSELTPMEDSKVAKRKSENYEEKLPVEVESKRIKFEPVTDNQSVVFDTSAPCSSPSPPFSSITGSATEIDGLDYSNRRAYQKEAHILGTASTKLTYIASQLLKYHQTDKIIVYTMVIGFDHH
jgi:hypothetical protein